MEKEEREGVAQRLALVSGAIFTSVWANGFSRTRRSGPRLHLRCNHAIAFGNACAPRNTWGRACGSLCGGGLALPPTGEGVLPETNFIVLTVVIKLMERCPHSVGDLRGFGH